jgi:calcineurin-like phosphoesterase family protein
MKPVEKLDLKTIFNENSFIISDHHFNHKNIEKYEPIRKEIREKLGFDTFEEMLIENHNKVVKPEDIVIFLGDFAWGSPSNWISKLNGKKYLILGNHDPKNHQSYVQDFEHVFKGIHVEFKGVHFVSHQEDELVSAVIVPIDGKNILFNHYPLGYNDEYERHEHTQKRLKLMDEITQNFDLTLCVHGHIHSKSLKGLEKFHYYVNVSCEVINFTPIKIRDIL